MPNIRRTTDRDNVCILTFDREGSSANIFDKSTLLELAEHIEAIRRENPRGLVITSAKESIFLAGADLNALSALEEDGLKSFIELGQTVFNNIAALPFPTVAAIHGACVGGGCEICLACDYRVATDDHSTKIGLPEVKLGILPAWGGSTRLPRLIGIPRALDIILGGKTLPAKPALKKGLIDLIAPREYLMRAALDYARGHKPHRFLSRMLHSAPANKIVALAIGRYVNMRTLERTRGNYPAVEEAMRVILRGAGEFAMARSLALEVEAVMRLARSPESKNLLRLFLLQEGARKLSWPGAQKLPPRKMTKGAVIGAGVMGASISQWLSARGMRVILKDIDAARVAAGMERIVRLFASAYKRHTFTFVEARDGVDRISPASADVPMKGVEIFVEAAVEKMDLKKKIFARLDEQASADAILATNTSALSITEIAASTKNPERVVGIHFFNPVHKMQLVEVVAGKQTSPEVMQRALRFVQQLGKLPVVVQDSPGFLVNRILLPYLVEAAALFEAGAPVEILDEAMCDFGMPMGPLRLIDEVGVDIAADVAMTLASVFKDRLKMPEALAGMMREGLLGRKSGAGFYTYKTKEPKVNPHAAKFRTSASAAGLNVGELQRRMVLLMVNEAARCLEEKIVSKAGDVDFAMVMGTGFAPFRGGPLAYADALTPAKIVTDMKTLVVAAGLHYEPCALLSEMAASGRKFYEEYAREKAGQDNVSTKINLP